MWYFLLSLISVQATAVPRALTNPTVKSTTLTAVVSDPHLNRDSCGSALWGNRTLWTCRDTQIDYANGSIASFFSSSASYGDLNCDRTVPFQPVPSDQPVDLPYPAAYLLYGDNKNESFYTILSDECGTNQAGSCPNGSRWAIWEDSPPLVTNPNPWSLTAYTWVKKSLIQFLTNEIADPATTLYKVTGTNSQKALPSVSVIDENFWQVNEFAYGEYGGLIVGDDAYLYGVQSNFSVGLAKVPISCIENQSAYSYWNHATSSWTTKRPTVFDSDFYLPNAGTGGQGTFYYSEPWGQYVWIGQPARCACPQVSVAVSLKPEGPWTTPTVFMDVTPGNYPGIGAYSMQAHPELVPGPMQNSIYVTYVQQNNGTPYETPMYLVEWN